MLYYLLYQFHTQISVLNVTRYITFRTAAESGARRVPRQVQQPFRRDRRRGQLSAVPG